MASIGKDVKVGKLTVEDAVNFEPGSQLNAANVFIKTKFELGEGCEIIGLNESYATDTELTEVNDNLSGRIAVNEAAVTDLNQRVSTNKTRIDSLSASLSQTDAEIVQANAEFVTRIDTVESDLESNAVLIQELRTDIDSNAAILTQDVVDLASNVVLINGLRTDVDAQAASLISLDTEIGQDIVNLASNVVLINQLRTDVDSNAATILQVIQDVASNVVLIDALRADLDSNASIITSQGVRLGNVEDSISTIGQLQSLVDGSITDSELNALTGTLVLTLFGALQNYALQADILAVYNLVEGLASTTNTAGNFFGDALDFLDEEGNDTSTPLQRQVIQNTADISTHTQQISDLNSLSQTNADRISDLDTRTNQLSTKIVTELWSQDTINALTYATQEDLEAQLVTQPSRVDTLSSDYTALNSSVLGAVASIAALSTGSTATDDRVTTAETDLISNVTRIETLETTTSSHAAKHATLDDGFFKATRTINASYSNGVTTAWKRIATISGGSGIVKIQGVIGGHDYQTSGQGHCAFNLMFSARDGFKVFGDAHGSLKGGTDLIVYLDTTSIPDYPNLTVYVKRTNYTAYSLTSHAIHSVALLDDAWTTTDPTNSHETVSFTLTTHLNTDTYKSLFYNGTANPLFKVVDTEVQTGQTQTGQQLVLGQLTTESYTGTFQQKATIGSDRTYQWNASGSDAENFEMRDVTGNQRAYLYGTGSGTYRGWRFYENGTERVIINQDGLTVNGTITATGGFGDPVITFTKALQIGTTWMDTGIAYTDLATGTHAVQIYDVDDASVGGRNYDETYSGVMSWFAGITNSGEATEIHLTSAGHAPNDNHIYLRVLRAFASTGVKLRLQVRRDFAMTGSYTYTFKFKKLI